MQESQRAHSRRWHMLLVNESKILGKIRKRHDNFCFTLFWFYESYSGNGLQGLFLTSHQVFINTHENPKLGLILRFT